MATKFEVYKCEICGNIVEVLHGGKGALVCCGQKMDLLEEQTEDQTKEKHVPYIEATASGVKVKVGKETAHPMQQKHYIEFIEVLNDNMVARMFLSPGEDPETAFQIAEEKIQKAREYCNVHGLWKFEK